MGYGHQMSRHRIVVMGPSGSGKTAVGQLLAQRLGIGFVDGDDLHPPSNVAKMTAGKPLDDADRMPWLDAVGAAIADRPDGVVVACSALRRRYRERLLTAAPDAVFVQLDVDRQTLEHRMRGRSHFMPPSLLDSQLSALEPLQADEPGVVVPASGSVDEVVSRVIELLAQR